MRSIPSAGVCRAPLPGTSAARALALGWLGLLWLLLPRSLMARTPQRVPTWVEPSPVDLDIAPPTSLARPAIQYLLADEQIRIDSRVGQPASASRIVHYAHFAYRISSHLGLEEMSRVELDYAPSHNTIALHHIGVWRDGVWQDRLATTQLREIQRETNLWRHILDGTHTQLLVLSDIQVGDVLSYAYSIQGYNPVFDGHFSGEWDMAWAEPVAHRQLRLIHPVDQPLSVAVHGALPEPIRTREGSWESHRWDLYDIPAVEPETGTPPGIDQVPWVQASTYGSWAEVVEWAVSLYRRAGVERTGVAAQASALGRADPKETMLASLRWVQDEIRYFGVELGHGSHLPRSPRAVLERYYGDCKDKALLLSTLLEQHEIRAWPALVSAREGGRVGRWHPSPTAFDHVIVGIELEGQWLWVDPSLSLQGGIPGALSLPRYEQALLLRSGEQQLRAVAGDAPPLGLIDTRMRYRIEQQGGPVELAIETHFEGVSAEETRRWLGDTTSQRLEQHGLGRYQPRQGTISLLRPIELEDSRRNNQLVAREAYLLTDAWEQSQVGSLLELSPPDLLHALPRSAARSTPLALPRGLREITSIELEVPVGWVLAMPRTAIKNHWFELELRSRQLPASDPERQRVRLRYSLVVRGSQVAPEELLAYHQDLDTAWQWLGYTLQLPAEGAGLDTAAAPSARRAGSADGGAGLLSRILGALITLLLAGLVGLLGLQLRQRRRQPPGGSP